MGSLREFLISMGIDCSEQIEGGHLGLPVHTVQFYQDYLLLFCGGLTGELGEPAQSFRTAYENTPRDTALQWCLAQGMTHYSVADVGNNSYTLSMLSEIYGT